MKALIAVAIVALVRQAKPGRRTKGKKDIGARDGRRSAIIAPWPRLTSTRRSAWRSGKPEKDCHAQLAKDCKG